jgi:hypothetical protein
MPNENRSVTTATSRKHNRGFILARQLAAPAMLTALLVGSAALARHDDGGFRPGNLLVSRSVYDNNANNIHVGDVLPPGCVTGCGVATSDGTYPFVFGNNLVDGSFGITAKIFLDQITPTGTLINSLEVPSGSHHRDSDHGESDDHGSDSKDLLVTSFSSKSEVALNLSTDGNYVTFMGYVAPLDAIDVSNSNTALAPDPTNPVLSSFYRAVAKLDREGNLKFTESNAYSGNNGRAAILNNSNGANVFYMSGNAGNGGNPQPAGILIGGGAQILAPTDKAEVAQTPGNPTPVGSFNITELGAAHDKLGKDNNFRGLTIFNNAVYFTKGSGGNGVNTVYFIDTNGSACPLGVGLPVSGATLPTSALPYDPSLLATEGLNPNNMCILNGFPSTLNSKLKTKTTAYPFGIWFADANTLYVADEGDGALADAGLTPAGLQKWVFDPVAGKWNLKYTMQTGLGLGATYPFPGSAAYPTGINPATGAAWAPLTDGLRNITGRVNGDGTATIWGITSTVSGNGDQGADPNKLVAITDVVANTNPAVGAAESFVTIRTAGYGEVLRGVSFTPGTVPAKAGCGSGNGKGDGNHDGNESGKSALAKAMNCDN